MKDQSESLYDFEKFEIFPWCENLDLKNSEIDDQHMSLVEQLNSLARALVNNNDVQIEKAFDMLMLYADNHFEAEEKYWQEYMENDPWVVSHRELHRSFLPSIEEIKSKYTSFSDDDTLSEIIIFLIKWLAFHIVDSDKRMSIAVEEIKKGKDIEKAKLYSMSMMNTSMKQLTDTILMMYEGLSGNAIRLMKERRIRIKVEEKLKKVNDELERLSITDPLTGLFNRRHFNNLGQREFQRALRDHNPLGFIEMDIDHFKKVNDSQGHQAGDRILERLGLILRKTCRRPGDYSFRLGGEEFAVLLINQDTEGTKIIAEKIRISFQEEVGVTLSCGVRAMVPEKGDRLEDLVSSADAMLYKAKESGRNRTIAYS